MANLANLIVRGLSRLGNVVASKITATEFEGDLTGTASKATADANGDNITTTYLKASQKGAVSGVAELDSSGKVPSSQLPSYVDDVLEYSSKSSFHTTGETGKIYVDTATNLTYRWSGSAYVEISPSLALGTTSSTAYRGDYGAAAYAHAVTNKGSAFTSGLYKITTNSEGHVTAATAVTKADITALGIPGSDTNTTYTASTESIGSASGWSAGSIPTLGTAIPADDITSWSAGTAASASASKGVVTFTNGTAPNLQYTAKSIPNVTSAGTAPSLTITSKTVVTGITED